jgi:hypothetical protein
MQFGARGAEEGGTKKKLEVRYLWSEREMLRVISSF